MDGPCQWLADTEVQTNFFSFTHVWSGDALSNLTHLGTATNWGSTIVIGSRKVHRYPHGDALVEAGVTYKISVASEQGGPFRLTLTLATLSITSPTNGALLTQAQALPFALSPPNPDIDGPLRSAQFAVGLEHPILVTNTWPMGPITLPEQWLFVTTNAANLSVLASNLYPENYIVTARATNEAGRVIITPPVNFRVRPANDDFASATVITDLPFIAPHYFINATNEPGEPLLPNQSGGASVWWRWTAPSNGTVALLGEAAYGVFTGTSIDALTVIATGYRDVRFTAVTGITYCFKAARLSTNADAILPSGSKFRLYWVPANDAFESRIALSGGTVTVVGDNSAAREETNEPYLQDSYYPPGHTVWYSWTAPAAGQANIEITSAGNFMSASAWTGNALTNLQLAAWTSFYRSSTPVGCIFCPPPGPTRGWLRFPVEAGETYQLCFGGSESSFRFDIDLCSVMITNPPDGSVLDGDIDLTIHATAPRPDIEGEVGGIMLNGWAPPTDWWEWWRSVPCSDPANISVMFSNLAPNDYRFYLQMTNAAGRLLISRTNHVRIRPFNDDFASAYVLSSNYFHPFTLAGAAEEPDEPVVPGQTEARSIWYRWACPVDAVVLAYAPPKAVGVFTGGSIATLQSVESTSIQGRVRFQCRAGELYHFKVAPTSGYKLGFFSLSSLWPNDDFSGSIPLTGTDISLVISNVPSSIEPNEPSAHTNSSSFRGSLWWTWTAPASGALFVSNAEDEYYEDWHFYAYTGTSLDALVLKAPVIQNDPAGIRYRVAAGETLHFLAGAFYEPVVFNLRFIPDPPRQRLSPFPLHDGSYLLAFTDEPGQRYVLETSTDFEHWYDRGVIDSAEMTIYFRFADLEDRPWAFFRVRRIGPAPRLE